MRILILGCDKLGAHLATDLAGDGHRVSVLDPRPDRLDALPQNPHLETVMASDSLIEDLRGVGINSVDVFLALSQDDSRNAMAAQVASHIFHVPEVICRIGDPQRGKMYRGLGMNVVCPTVVMMDTIKSSLGEAKGIR